MGTSFGAAVASLLDAYETCLSLLKTFRGSRSGRDEADAAAPSHAPFANLQPSLLGTSLRSDQASIRRTYSSRLSQNGARLEKGDAPSRSAVRRIVRKLVAGLAEVVRSLENSKSPAIDYDSLLALSHGSSLDAVRTIEDLSSRVSSRASTSSGSGRSHVSRGRPRSRRHHHHGRSGDKETRKAINEQSAVKSRSERGGKARSKKSSTSQSSSNRSRRRHRHSSSHSRHAVKVPEHEKRVSIFTMSSDSTKLGEIRRRGSRQRAMSGKTTYPLYMYPPEKAKKQKKRWKLF